MLRSSRRRRRKQDRSRKILGLSLIGVAIAIVVAGTLYWYDARNSLVELDPSTLCPKSGPRSVTVVLLDRTDPLAVVQQADLHNQLETLVAEIPRYGELTIYSVEPVEERPLVPRYTMCNPGEGKDIDPTIGNPTMVQGRWETGFRAPLDAVLAELIAPTEEPTSPIMESIQSLAITTFGERNRREAHGRLVVVSDLMQHTAGYSQYRDKGPYDGFKRTAYFRRVQADLKGVEVELLYVRRDVQIRYGAAAHIEFWESYFRDQGAQLVRVRALPG